MLHISIADDHPLVVQGIRQIIDHTGRMRVCGAVDTTEGLFEHLASHRCDAVILDLDIPSHRGFGVLRQLKLHPSPPPVLVLSFHPEQQYASTALSLGAKGYLNKSAASDTLVEAIEVILSGGSYVSPHVAGQLAGLAAGKRLMRPHERLSPREFEIMCLLAEGRRVSDIANLLELNIKTVSTHKTHILDKMEISSLADIVKYAVREDILP